MMFPERIQAARLSLVRERPYLAVALWALAPVERPGLGTLAVDKWWRVYFDPAVCDAWTVEQLAGVLYHEICHLLRGHHARAAAVSAEAQTWNICADAEINDDLRAEKVALPGQPIFPETLSQPEGKLAEEYYNALAAQAQQSAPQQGASAQPESDKDPGAGQSSGAAGQQEDRDPHTDGRDGAAQGNGSPDATPGGEGEAQPDRSSTAEGGGHADDAQPGDGGDTPSSKAGDSSGSQPGDAAGSSPAASSGGQPGAASAQGGASSGPPTDPVGSGRAGGHDGTASGAEAQTPAPGAGRCGSCAHGQQEPWEDGPPGTPGAPTGITDGEAELIRRRVAQEIVRVAESSRDRGTIPGHWRRWAEDKLRPRVDWRRELASHIRRAVADVAGAADYTYRRPSRRQGQVGNGKVIFPSLRQPVPSVAVVVDTSGSIDDRRMGQALAEVAGILQATGQREAVNVLAVDAAVQSCRRVFRPEQVELLGGGGTDMRVGIEAALRLRPHPHVIVVITDGHTPWPDEPPRNADVIVALCGDGSSPRWAKTVKIE